MSVYTQIEPSQMEAFLALFDSGSLIEYSGITAGIENSNYLVKTTQGEYVLTLFEHHAASEVQQFIALARHLGEHSNLPVPAPIVDKNGVWLHELEAKPAILC
ncbi:MAG: phosphotransferase, partial [Oceanobacter sp.]